MNETEITPGSRLGDPRPHRLGDMRVRRVFSDRGRSSRIEPQFDSTWSDLTALRWWAAVAALPSRGDVRISVTHGLSKRTRGRVTRVSDDFCLSIAGPGGSTGYSSAGYDVTHLRLEGIEMALSAIYGDPHQSGARDE